MTTPLGPRNPNDTHEPRVGKVKGVGAKPADSLNLNVKSRLVEHVEGGKPLKGRASVLSESVSVPSSLFASRAYRKEGKTLFEIGKGLENLARKGLSADDLVAYLDSSKVEDKDKAQVLALAKREFPVFDGSPFHTLDLLHNTYRNFYPGAAGKASDSSRSPREVSLAEGKLPDLDPEFRTNLIGYLQGVKPASTLGINADTYQGVLEGIKVFDLELDRDPSLRKTLNLKNSTYELRTRCLVASEGRMPTFEAYTKSAKREYFDNPFSVAAREYASHEENFVPERVALHAQVAMRFATDMIGLSKRFGNDEPTIYALSGNTAVGKSFTAKHDPDFIRGVDEKGEAKGALNPDTVKALLRRGVDGITNQQIHIEGFAINAKLAAELKSKALQTSMVLDERLGTVPAITDLVEMARKSGKKLVLKDIDAPLQVSALRVLGRDVKVDPCVPFGPIASGYLAICRDRAEVLQVVLKSPEIESYELFVMDESGRSGFAARKVPATETKPARLEILDEELYAYALGGEKRAEEEINSLRTAVLSDSLFKAFEGKGLSKKPLEHYEGMTVGDALLKHSLKLPKWSS
jgi:hypothetical protein